MFAGKPVCCPGVQEKRAFCVRDVVTIEHGARLFLGAAGLSDLERIIVAAAGHVLLADPAVDQRLQGFHSCV